MMEMHENMYFLPNSVNTGWYKWFYHNNDLLQFHHLLEPIKLIIRSNLSKWNEFVANESNDSRYFINKFSNIIQIINEIKDE